MDLHAKAGETAYSKSQQFTYSIMEGQNMKPPPDSPLSVAARPDKPTRSKRSADRRQEVITAAWRTIEELGIEQATLRAVARKMGLTTGVISHYFAEKDELLLCVLARLLDMFEKRLAWEPRLSLSEFRDQCAALLPLDAECQSMWRIWTAFVGISDGRTKLVGEQEARYNFARDGFARQFAYLQKAGEISAPQDSTALGAALMSLIDGIGLHYVISPNYMNEAMQEAALDAFFGALSAGSKIDSRTVHTAAP